jgi:hypothetical protein
MEYDNRLTPSHISLYIALFRNWNFHRFKNPFPIYRENIMLLSKLGSKNTYHRCIKELHAARYIYYHPAPSIYKPASISMLPIEIKEEKDPTQLNLFAAFGKLSTSPKNGTHICPRNETHTSIKSGTRTSTDNGTQHVPKVGHYIKHINNINSECKHTHTEIFEKKEGGERPVNAPARVPVLGHVNDPPALEEVENFFRENRYPELEAKKFFYFNKAKNWMLQKDTPITDWGAVAHKWMLNVTNFNVKQDERKQGITTDTGANKDYTEPL